MFKGLLKLIAQQPDDAIATKLQSEPIVSKYWINLGAALVLALATMSVGTLVLLKRSHVDPPESNIVNLQKKTIQTVVTLPYPHQSFKNLSGWVAEAIRVSYGLSFSKIDDQIADAEYYFTPTGYTMYLKALESSHFKADIVNKRLEVGVVPIQNPVLINSGTSGDTEFWRIRVPILTSFYAGEKPVIQNSMVEVLVIRVPAYKNPKGLAITEFNITPI